MQSDHTCEYVYSVQMDQFKNEDQPMTVTATAQITCESSEKNFIIAIFTFYVDVNIYQILLVHSSLSCCQYNSAGGSYGSVDATRYCMVITGVGGNFLRFGQNQSNETDVNLRSVITLH